jgi:hypothetical protein
LSVVESVMEVFAFLPVEMAEGRTWVGGGDRFLRGAGVLPMGRGSQGT